jgi:rsbT co-antagonist protein RsbR
MDKRTNQAITAESTEALQRELVTHFREAREPLRRQWVQQMTVKGLLAGLTPAETESESATIYDTCIGCLETGRYDGAQVYAAQMAERGVLQGMTSGQIIGGMLTLRDVYGRSLFERYQQDMGRLSAALDIYEPVANQILSIVALAFVEEREKVVRQQQQVIIELSTPVIQVWQGILTLPIVGAIDSPRAAKITEDLLERIVARQARVVIMDITGVPLVDTGVANRLLKTVRAASLLGAHCLLVGIRPEIAQTVVHLGVDLSGIETCADLQSGLERAFEMVGLAVGGTTQ